jgi:glycosyltransferase involved in cell wall biosynthesis
MNILLLSSRFPWPAYTGDRVRAGVWLSALAERAEVTLVSPPGRVPAHAPSFAFQPAALSLPRAAAGVLRVAAGLPVHSILGSAFDWRGAIARARSAAGAFDATVVLLARFDPWVRHLLPPGLHVLDAIDSLERSMAERAGEAPPPARWFWRAEERRMGRLERDAVNAYDRIVVVSATGEADALRATPISNGVDIHPLADAPRPYDFAFWGRLAYFANADAAAWLIDEIWPLVRERIPNATLLIAGADAPARIAAAHGRSGITVQSPVEDIAALARQVTVALFPVRFGTGQANKVLEAAEAGCAIVATPKALRDLDPLARSAWVAEDASGLADAAADALEDRARAAAMGKALRSTVVAQYARSEMMKRLAAIVLERGAAA